MKYHYWNFVFHLGFVHNQVVIELLTKNKKVVIEQKIRERKLSLYWENDCTTENGIECLDETRNLINISLFLPLCYYHNKNRDGQDFLN